jgi:hypothetical protein
LQATHGENCASRQTKAPDSLQIGPDLVAKLDKFEERLRTDFYHREPERGGDQNAIADWYRLQGHPDAPVILCESPLQFFGYAVLIDRLASGNTINRVRLPIVDEAVNTQFWKSFDEQTRELIPSLSGKAGLISLTSVLPKTKKVNLAELRECSRSLPADVRCLIFDRSTHWRTPTPVPETPVLGMRAMRIVEEAYPDSNKIFAALSSPSAFDSGAEIRAVLRHYFTKNVAGFDVYKATDFRIVDAVCALMQCSWRLMAFDEICFVCRPPVEAYFDQTRRLHRTDGAAALFPDGFKVYALLGVEVGQHVIETPGSMTVKEIEETENVELRRVLINVFGCERYLKESGAELIHEDEFGKLYRKLQELDEQIVMVAVKNSTPDLDGSFKTYYMRVPPEMVTAKEAVAWTFGLDRDDYGPLVES